MLCNKYHVELLSEGESSSATLERALCSTKQHKCDCSKYSEEMTTSKALTPIEHSVKYDNRNVTQKI